MTPIRGRSDPHPAKRRARSPAGTRAKLTWVAIAMLTLGSVGDLVAIWCQFAQTPFYYPALLAYVASTLAYVFAPSLAHSGLYTTVVIIVLFWSAVLVSARGVLSTGRLASYGVFIGTVIPGLLIVVLATIYLLQGNSSAAPLNAHHVLPPWHGLSSIVLIVNGFF